MKRYLILSLCLSLLLGFAMPAYAQQPQTVKGSVVDETGEPVIGASVKIEGTSTGTITDLNGNFTIPVPSKGQLTVSFIGYVSQTVSDFKNTRIVLKEDYMQLEEVVVVGYGAQKKAHLTGSIATVAPQDFNDLSVTNLGAALEGLINGVSVNESSNRPGEPAKIVIRNSDLSISAPTSSSGLLVPLYVIDDFIADETAFNNLDGSMIESISVLKDAAAAVYGARSAQGVVLVKTKRGQISKPKISYNGQFGYTDEFYRSKMMDSYSFGRTWNAIRVPDPTGTYDKKNDLFQADELEAMRSLNYDLLDKYWSSGLTQKHSINIGGGSENATYFGGVSYVTQEGNLGRIEYGRWNYRAGMDVKISPWVKASLQVSGDYGETTKAFSTVGGTNDEKDYVMLLTRPRYIPEYVNGLPVAGYGITNGYIEQTQNYHYDMVENVVGNYTTYMPQNMTINSSLEYDFGWSKIFKGLKVKMTYSKNISTTKDNQFGSDYQLYKFADGNRGGSGSHLYMDTPGYAMNFENMTTVPVSNGDRIRRTMSRSDRYQLNFIATYARSFGLHDVSGLFSIEKSENETENIWGQVTEPYSFTNGQSNGANGTQTTEFKRSEGGVLSYIGRVNYAYADRYLAEFLIRSDASTKFAPENYWGVFPSLSVGWIISEESWFKDKTPFDFLKIRASYGLLGRDNVAAWAWQQTYGSEVIKGPIFGSNPSLEAGAHFQIPNEVPNRNSHWDKSYKSNIGLDMNFIKSRLSVTLDAYYDKNREVFMAITNIPDFPTTVGAIASASNYGSIDSYGVELSLGWRDKIGKDFKYHIKLNTGYTDNKILKAPWKDIADRELDDIVPNERADRGVWGYSCIGMFRSYQEIAEYFAANNIETYMGKMQVDVHPGTLIYKNVRGSRKSDGTYYAAGDPNDPMPNVVDKNDKVQISKRSGNPYGFTINLGGEWKALSFSAQLGASWGSYTTLPTQAISNKSIVATATTYDVMQYTNLPSFWADNMFVYKDVLDEQGRVVATQNLTATYPNLRFASINSESSTFWRISNTNISLRNITLAYALPKTLINRLGLESCRFNLTGQNLLCFYNPYPDKFMSPMSDYSKYPTLRKFTLGVNVSF
ncbi:MAG: TonB-dependent receptor [Mediterranea sp.]|jgi:TonB-linked SusC/RagA family outer membrane protein|nr:TonB-dependent receptor [Mediterranea sp.]